MSRSPDSLSLQSLVRERIDDWRSGGEPDAAGVLARHPELSGAKSLVMDLVLAEFNLRSAAGDPTAKSTLCDRLPAYKQSIEKLLQVQEFLDRCPNFAVDDDHTRWPVPGHEFLGYKIVEPLGRGGLARVFLARESAVGGRLVVIKISRLPSREAQTLGKLSHPSIMPIHSVKHDDEAGWTVICMPLVGVATAVDLLDAAFGSRAAHRDGRLIARIARDTKPLEPVPEPIRAADESQWRLPYPDAIARIGWQLAEALDAAHAAGILHRDIKPSNVLLAWSGRSMLLDFNLSTDAAAGRQHIGGTLAYMAPELIECLAEGCGETAGRFDPRCDIYSLGAVLYELLTGRLPAKPDNADHLPLDAYQPWLESKRQQPSPLASPQLPIDPRLEAIVLRCLALDAAGRYATAAALATDLRAYLGSAAQLSRFARRHRRALLLGAVGLLGGSIGLGAYIANRPAHWEVVYRRGLAEYQQGQYQEAVETFTNCLELKAGWPQALFGRAQALRKLERWREARIDYTGLNDVDKKWSRALAGYCNMRLGDNANAFFDFRIAHEEGLRDIGFLVNYARVQSKLQRYPGAADAYSQVLEFDAKHPIAVRNRGMVYLFSVTNTKKIPCEQAFQDVQEDCRLNPSSYEAPFCAAIVFGEAARKDANYEQQAVEYLTLAMERGLPLEFVDLYKLRLAPLVGKVPEPVVAKARVAKPQRPFILTPYQDPPETAEWDSFLRVVGVLPQLLARSK